MKNKNEHNKNNKKTDQFSMVYRWLLYNTRSSHNDVIKWKYYSHNWPFVRGIHRWPVNSPHKGQWRGALMFSLICAWINNWANNGDAADLRRHNVHHDVTVMFVCRRWNMWTSGSIMAASGRAIFNDFRMASSGWRLKGFDPRPAYRHWPWMTSLYGPVICTVRTHNWCYTKRRILQLFITMRPIQNEWHFADDTVFSIEWKVLYLKIHWSLFPWAQLTIYQ